MLDTTLHINSTISNAHKGARYLGVDIKNVYIDIPMLYFQYIHVLPNILPQEVWDDPHHNIHIASDGFIYLEIQRGIYGLKEA